MTSQNTLNPEGRRSQARHLVLVDDLGLHGLHADECPRVFQNADEDYLSLRVKIPLLGSSTEDIPLHPQPPYPYPNSLCEWHRSNQYGLDFRLMNLHALLLCAYDFPSRVCQSEDWFPALKMPYPPSLTPFPFPL